MLIQQFQTIIVHYFFRTADTALRKPLAFDIGFLEDQTTLQSKPRKYPRRLEVMLPEPDS